MLPLLVLVAIVHPVINKVLYNHASVAFNYYHTEALQMTLFVFPTHRAKHDAMKRTLHMKDYVVLSFAMKIFFSGTTEIFSAFCCKIIVHVYSVIVATI